jgi:hypothetical protein
MAFVAYEKGETFLPTTATIELELIMAWKAM